LIGIVSGNSRVSCLLPFPLGLLAVAIPLEGRLPRAAPGAALLSFAIAAWDLTRALSGIGFS
jgi:hypothetical protein